MTAGKSSTEVTENGAGQFSKFSINQDRPAKRRRNVNQVESSSSPAGGSPSSAGTAASQAEKDGCKNKDSAVAPASRSCAECRRMKLKCDRIFPCKTCVRRGLEGICPEGSLVTGRGTRYVLASTQELHEKILKMADRIKSLEDALAALHQEHSNCRPCTCQTNQKRTQPAESHPLLRSDLLLIKGQLELYGLGPSKEQDGSSWENATQFESSASQDASRAAIRPGDLRKEVPDSELHQDGEATKATEPKRRLSDSGEKPKVARRAIDVKRKRQAEESPVERGKRLRAMLPPPEEAEYLAREAVWHGTWIINITSRPAKRARLLHELYYGPLEEIRPQDIALVLTALALGERVDMGTAAYENGGIRKSADILCSPPNDSCTSDVDHQATDVPVGISYEDLTKKRDIRGSQRSSSAKRCSRSAQESYNHAKAALNEVSIQGEPDQTVVHCLYLMAWYLAALADNKDAGREAMAAVSVAVMIAFKTGMHVEETYTGLSAEAQQERRILFWALLHLESRLHLDASSPGVLGTRKITAERPFATIPGAIKSFPTQTEAIYHDFKLEFLEKCILPTLELVEKAPKLRVKEKDYDDVLDLDGIIRDFPLPAVLAEPISAPPPTDSSEFLHVSSHTDLNFILNPGTNASSFDLSYGEGRTPRNVLRMVRVKAQQERLMTLLYLHRTFFYAHIRDHRPLVQRMFLPSCLAAFSAASELIRSVREIYAAEPELTARVSMFWYNGFLATITLFLLVVYKPFCPVTVIALQEIERSRNLFQTASTKCHFAAQSYTLLRDLFAKASEVYDRWKEESEGDMNVFGPNGEVTFCQTRIDIVIERLQSATVPSAAEEDATSGLLSLKRCSDSPPAPKPKPCEKPCQPCPGPKTDDGPSLEMWQHVHKEITDFVRRLPEVLRDAAIDPRRATAARLIWGFIPIPEEEPKYEDILVDEPDFGAGLPTDLDWNAFADALMFAPMTHPDSLGGSSANSGPTPPATTCSPESSQSTFSFFESLSDFDFGNPGRTGLTPDINMDSGWAMTGHDDELIGPPNDYGNVTIGPLRSDWMLGTTGGEHGYSLHKGGGIGQVVNRFDPTDILSADSGELDDGTLGYLWQHRIQSPYLT